MEISACQNFTQVATSARFVKGVGFNPPLVPLNPQVFIDPHWFSQKYIKKYIAEC